MLSFVEGAREDPWYDAVVVFREGQGLLTVAVGGLSVVGVVRWVIDRNSGKLLPVIVVVVAAFFFEDLDGELVDLVA